MKERMIGIDLCDTGTGIAFFDADSGSISNDALKTKHFPTALCRDKKNECWYIGEDAYAHALNGEGILTDKLLTFAEKDGVATICGIRYEANELLRIFLEEVISGYRDEAENKTIAETVICIPRISRKMTEELKNDMEKIGTDRKHVHIISRAESFIYYTACQPRDVWNNRVGLFSLSDSDLVYYEMSTSGQNKKTVFAAQEEKTEESFNLDILTSLSGMRLADKILVSCADRLMKKKLFSSVLLTGKGFEKYDWAKDFMKYICNRRKVFQDQDLFARGSCVRANEYRSDAKNKAFLCICDGRLDSSVSLTVEKGEKEFAFPVAGMGDSWVDSDCSLFLLPGNSSELIMEVAPFDARRKKIVRIPLSFLPKRPVKTQKISFHAFFSDSRTMAVEVSDAGFGELFPKTDACIRQEVQLWD